MIQANLEPVPSLIYSALFAGLTILAMIGEYWRITGGPEAKALHRSSLILEKFPEEEPEEVTPSFLFKFLVLILPAPLIFAFLVAIGFRSLKELLPIFLFAWAIMDLAVYLIFFADLSDLGGFRRPMPGG